MNDSDLVLDGIKKNVGEGRGVRYTVMRQCQAAVVGHHGHHERMLIVIIREMVMVMMVIMREMRMVMMSSTLIKSMSKPEGGCKKA